MTDTDPPVPASALGQSLTTGGGYRKWLRLVGLTSPKPYGGNFRVYVIDVEPLTPDCTYVFYVGYTAATVDNRFPQHVQGGPLAARIFRASGSRLHPLARALRLREDLMLGTPLFRSKEAAMQAEGLLARMLEARGHPTKSDAKDRAALHNRLRQRSRGIQASGARTRGR